MNFAGNIFQIPPNDRAIFIGGTGSGKTTLAKFVITQSPKWKAVYDAKGYINWRGFQIYDSLEMIRQSARERIIYQPSIEEENDYQTQDAFFNLIYQQKNRLLYVDEAYALLGDTRPSPYLKACLTRGRERGISTYVATQRPSGIPIILLSESEHYFIFRLNWPADRKRVAQVTGIDEDFQATLQPHEFIYANPSRGITTQKLKLQFEE